MDDSDCLGSVPLFNLQEFGSLLEDFPRTFFSAGIRSWTVAMAVPGKRQRNGCFTGQSGLHFGEAAAANGMVADMFWYSSTATFLY